MDLSSKKKSFIVVINKIFYQIFFFILIFTSGFWNTVDPEKPLYRINVLHMIRVSWIKKKVCLVRTSVTKQNYQTHF